jgi:uncharacterized protein with PQ loop repeat
VIVEMGIFLHELVGLIGSVCFAFGPWPQAFLSWKKQRAKGVTWSFILLWLSGSFFSSIYAIATEKYVLLPNYICGGLGISIVLYVKIKETLRKKGKNA